MLRFARSWGVWALGLIALPALAQQPGGLEPPVKLMAGDEPIDTGASIGHAGPLFADYDRDGLPDLLVGNFKGTIQLYRNRATLKAPVFAAEGLLEAEGERVTLPNW